MAEEAGAVQEVVLVNAKTRPRDVRGTATSAVDARVSETPARRPAASVTVEAAVVEATVLILGSLVRATATIVP